MLSKTIIKIVPITFKKACEYIQQVHRHHKPPQGHKFSIGLENQDGNICGVVCIGRPVARGNDDGATAEVTRLCTDGTKNACSMLYSAAARASEAMGYKKIITYILSSETGISLKASGWQKVAEVKGRSWSCTTRPREDNHPLDDKTRWEKILGRNL
jgi:hypothetical protein